jgi:hypothetical protein
LAATRTGITQFVAIFVFIGSLAKIQAIGFGLQAWIPSDKRRLIVIAWVFDTGEQLHNATVPTRVGLLVWLSSPSASLTIWYRT